MPELDYAMLAEFAKVEGDQLTIVGASYTHLEVPQLPIQHIVYVAGRVRARKDEDPFPMRVGFRDPELGLEVSADFNLEPRSVGRPYGDKVGLMFALAFGVPISHTGLYEVLVDVDGERSRRLAFEVTLVQP